MRPFGIIESSIDSDGYKLIHWELISSFTPTEDIDFYVDRARSGGSWERISSALTNLCDYTDAEKVNFNKDIDTYYRIAFKYNDEWYYSTPVKAGFKFPSKREWLLAREIVRKEYLDLKRFGGRQGKFLRRKHWGKKCPDCLDHDTDEISVVYCPTCLGTGFIGGYYPPIEMYIKNQSLLNSTKEVSQNTGIIQPGSVISAKTVAYPWIDTLDIWVDSITNERFTIHKIKPLAAMNGIMLTCSLELRLETMSLSNIKHSSEMNDKIEENPAPVNTSNNWKPDLDVDW